MLGYKTRFLFKLAALILASYHCGDSWAHCHTIYQTDRPVPDIAGLGFHRHRPC
jgi:hypothetical protein